MSKAEFRGHQPAAFFGPYDLIQAQDSVRSWVDDLYTQVPWLDGRLIEDVELDAFTANDIEHKLDRALRGWHAVRRPALQCSFRAKLDSAQSVPDNILTKVLFDGEDYDRGGVYDASTNFQFTAAELIVAPLGP